MNQRIKSGLTWMFKLPRNTNPFIWFWIILVVAIVLSGTNMWFGDWFAKLCLTVVVSCNIVAIFGFFYGLLHRE